MHTCNFIFWTQRHSSSAAKLPWVLEVPDSAMKDTSSTGQGHCRHWRVCLPPMAVPEPLIRKQLLKNTVPEREQGQQMEQVWVFPADASEMQPGCYYRRCRRAKESLAGKICTRDCCEKNTAGEKASVLHCSVQRLWAECVTASLGNMWWFHLAWSPQRGEIPDRTRGPLAPGAEQWLL